MFIFEIFFLCTEATIPRLLHISNTILRELYNHILVIFRFLYHVNEINSYKFRRMTSGHMIQLEKCWIIVIHVHCLP